MSNQNKSFYTPPFSQQVWFTFLKICSIILKPLYLTGKKIKLLWETLDFYRKSNTFPLYNDDILIVTYPKSGTTWLQMILYQLTTDGNMDFNHISEKIPFLERLSGIGEGNQQDASRRIFKTHLKYSLIPKGPCKYIYVVRDGRDVAVSYYHHYESLFGFKAPFEAFFRRFMKGRVQYGNWFKHVYHWHRNSKKLDVLYLSYEELKNDLQATIIRIAQFCEIPYDQEQLKRVVERSGFAFMKEHENKFEHITEVIVEQGWIPGQFIRKGKSKYWSSYFTPPQEELYQKQYQKWLENKKNT